MARPTYEEITAEIEAAKAEGLIWNVAYGDLKNAANRAYETEKDAIGAEFIWGGIWQSLAKHEQDAWGLVPFEIRHIAGKARKLPRDADSTLVRKIEALFARWAPVALGIEELKPLVKKGRKPNIINKPSDAHLRHTCQVCGGRFLGEARQVAFHGYQRPGDGFLRGSCYGASRPSFEVDRSVLGEWIEHLWATERSVASSLAALHTGTLTLRDERYKLDEKGRKIIGSDGRYEKEPFDVRPGEEGYSRLLGIRIAQRETELRLYQTEITRQQARYERWIPRRG